MSLKRIIPFPIKKESSKAFTKINHPKTIIYINSRLTEKEKRDINPLLNPDTEIVRVSDVELMIYLLRRDMAINLVPFDDYPKAVYEEVSYKENNI